MSPDSGWIRGNNRIHEPPASAISPPVTSDAGTRGRTKLRARVRVVLAAYACLAPRVVTGQFDPTHHRAIWPSTGNYCRGGYQSQYCRTSNRTCLESQRY